MNQYNPNFKPTKQYAIVGQKAVVFNDQGQLLLLQRSEKSGAGGKWSLPGGGLDKGEKSEEGILREIKEEVRIIVKDLQPFYIKTYLDGDDFIVIISYQAKYTSGNVVLNWEHDNFKWISAKEALSMNLTPDAKDIISNLKKD